MKTKCFILKQDDKDKLYLCTTEKEVNDFFAELGIGGFLNKIEILKDTMNIEDVYNVSDKYSDEDEFNSMLSIFLEGTWRLI